MTTFDLFLQVLLLFPERETLTFDLTLDPGLYIYIYIDFQRDRLQNKETFAVHNHAFFSFFFSTETAYDM